MILNQQALRATKIKGEKSDIKRKIKKVTLEDEYAKKIDNKNKNFKKEDGMILYHRLIYVSRKIRNEVMVQEHDTVTSASTKQWRRSQGHTIDQKCGQTFNNMSKNVRHVHEAKSTSNNHMGSYSQYHNCEDHGNL
ncbi:predicted protein [Uncinocarpus reesii 1704]|uniref:Uncharacterized protein n=1 Tax=Uncinocarpus reesii (strain UAMH 1704) TaxID=336963 RepID=C4JUD3_UNCRE|nr:uncharacterized protein UREG_06072 [Uncinocarpus reesii 1704]EEP81230.1 predicted protein [Uncinocarpus reesii 1704]